MQIIMNATRIGGSWANWYEGMFKCGGFQGQDMICVKDLDDKFEQYQKSFDRDERKKLAEEIQRASWKTIISCRCSATPSSTRSGRGSRRRNGRMCSRRSPAATPIPWEDIELKESRRRAELGQRRGSDAERRQ